VNPSSPPAPDPAASRRPIASRSARWAIAVSQALARSSVTPNQISVASVGFAALGGALIGLSTSPLGWIAAMACVQLRLICNLLDGMVAVEGGKATKLGSLYNEFPDRIADTLLLVPAGYAAGVGWLGWAAALAAALTAYVRVFGGALGLAQSFAGIMAKQRRMALLSLGLVAHAAEWSLRGSSFALTAAMAVIALGSLWTCVSRTLAIARALDRP
jgi:phosphatidylglycerophosphate synthase